MDTYRANYRQLKHGDPLPNAEPTPEQMGALAVRILVLFLAPYVDFGLFAPFGTRFQKYLRHKAWVKGADGTWSAGVYL